MWEYGLKRKDRVSIGRGGWFRREREEDGDKKGILFIKLILPKKTEV